MANPSRNLACSWITTHYLLFSRGVLLIIYLFRLYLPVVPLTRKSELSKFLLTLSPYGGAVAMLLSNQSCHSSLACSAALLEDAGCTCPVFDSFLDVGIVAFHSTCRQLVPHAVSFAPETHYRTCCTASMRLNV